MATLKENLIKEIQEINDDRVLESIRNLVHSVEDATRYIQVNDEQKVAFEEAREDYKKGTFDSTDGLFNELLND
jgi:predicted house-cleaning noncanonical NTP pyrophosphatase (MazG superfamily)